MTVFDCIYFTFFFYVFRLFWIEPCCALHLCHYWLLFALDLAARLVPSASLNSVYVCAMIICICDFVLFCCLFVVDLDRAMLYFACALSLIAFCPGVASTCFFYFLRFAEQKVSFHHDCYCLRWWFAVNWIESCCWPHPCHHWLLFTLDLAALFVPSALLCRK